MTSTIRDQHEPVGVTAGRLCEHIVHQSELYGRIAAENAQRIVPSMSDWPTDRSVHQAAVDKAVAAAELARGWATAAMIVRQYQEQSDGMGPPFRGLVAGYRTPTLGLLQMVARIAVCTADTPNVVANIDSYITGAART